ncbi:MAG TPA: sigma-70 family RNA polymerase sigma factor [Solirubrobacteraceae bacterium]|nr:sigma-70 family RNA polymerase sigma factor [Solirubrobacteraceae bacterium]
MPFSPSARTVRAAARGDQEAWNELVERYSGLLWGIARAHRLGTGDAADVVQTSWLRLVEHLVDVRNPDGIGSWLATTARRESLRTLRRSSRSEPSDAIDALPDPALTDVDARLLRDERDAALSRAFERLPARDQALLRLLTTEPAPSYEEISAALAMPIGSIGPTRGRALARLRRELRRAGTLDMARDMS